MGFERFFGYNLFQLLKQLQLADADSVKLKDYVSKLLDKLQGWLYIYELICGALRDLVPFVQFKRRENTHGGVLLLVKLQVSAYNFTKSNTTPWVFFTFYKLHKWYQIVQASQMYWFAGVK